VANVNLIVAGSRITAALLQSVAPMGVIKGADESVTSSTTLQNDNELFVPVIANATYLFDCYLDFEGGTAGASDIQWQWTIGAGTLRYQAIYAQASSGLGLIAGVTYAGSANVAAGTNGAGSLRGLSMNGTLVTSGASSLQLQWAQNTSSATATIVHAQSYLSLWRIT
jgi:hypothetical protein